MKTDQLKNIIRHIVMESLDALGEGFQRGEWWIDDTGNTTFADIEVGDTGHQGIILDYLVREIVEHFLGHMEEPDGTLHDYEESIREVLTARGRFDGKDEAEWEGRGPSEVIIRKLLEDKVYPTEEQANDAVYIAYNSTSKDSRDYAMKYLGWKIMKTFGNQLEVQTWHLTGDDLSNIVRGIWDVVEEDDEEDPLVNVTVQSSGKRYTKIPLSVLEKKLPQKLQGFQSGVHVGYTESINEDYHFHHKEYRMYEGNRHVIVSFDDNTRLKFEVHYRNAHGIDREKWRQKAMSTWKSCANELHRDVPLSDALNPIQKGWKECFKEALKHPKMKPYIREKFAKLFDDKGYPAKVQGKPQPVIDPVNFTPR